MTIIRRNKKDLLIKKTNNERAIVRCEHICEFCRHDFISSRHTAKYCSDACKQSAYYYRNK